MNPTCTCSVKSGSEDRNSGRLLASDAEGQMDMFLIGAGRGWVEDTRIRECQAVGLLKDARITEAGK